MKVFLAGGESRHWLWSYPVQIFLANWVGSYRSSGGPAKAIRDLRPYILESFFSVDKETESLLPYHGDFLLDSGAFTFMSGNGGNPDWDNYLERYAGFINRNKIKKFFELDIDAVVGYERVKVFRKKLEYLTGTQCIPVWHRSRGMDDFRRMCDEYDYVAIGGIVSGEIKNTQFGVLPKFIDEAHKRKAKIHGLGFTALDWLPKCHWDSVDSTAWTIGNRFGYIYWFDGKTIQKKKVPDGHRLKDSRATAANNFIEWVKFSKWADTHL